MGSDGVSFKSLIPVRTNVALAVLFAAAGLIQGWILPGLLLPLDAQWAWLLAPAVLLSNPMWALTHETFHGSFHPDARVNRIAGRSLSILHGGLYQQLQFAHLTHHRYNRSAIDRTEVHDPARGHGRAFAVNYYFTILGGLYLSEVAAALIVLLPKRHIEGIVRRKFSRSDAVSVSVRDRILATLLGRQIVTMRIDATLLLLFHGSCFWLYGGHWWLLAAALLGRGMLVSLSDNAYHYGTPLSDPGYGKNLRLGALQSVLLLHFNYHRVHHRYPFLPWKALPHTEPETVEFAESYWSAIAKQLKGPIPAALLGG